MKKMMAMLLASVMAAGTFTKRNRMMNLSN